MFNILFDRKLPAFSNRVSHDNYSSQYSRAMWNLPVCYTNTDYSCMSNRIKQGDVYRAILFTIC